MSVPSPYGRMLFYKYYSNGHNRLPLRHLGGAPFLGRRGASYSTRTRLQFSVDEKEKSEDRKKWSKKPKRVSPCGEACGRSGGRGLAAWSRRVIWPSWALNVSLPDSGTPSTPTTAQFRTPHSMLSLNARRRAQGCQGQHR